MAWTQTLAVRLLLRPLDKGFYGDVTEILFEKRCALVPAGGWRSQLLRPGRGEASVRATVRGCCRPRTAVVGGVGKYDSEAVL